MTDGKIDTVQNPTAVKGYNRLPQEAIDEMNVIKGIEHDLVELLNRHATTGLADPKLIEESKKQLMLGFMLSVRAIAQPQSNY